MTLTSVELLRKVVGVENVTAEETEALGGTQSQSTGKSWRGDANSAKFDL